MDLLRFAIIGGDMRQVTLAALLTADGHRVSAFAIDRVKPPDAALASSLEECVREADCVLLPMPLLREDSALNTPLSDMVLTTDEVFAALSPKQIVCGGRIAEIAHEQAAAHGLILLDYFTREELLIANAAITAEGAIQVAMEATPATLLGARVLLLGFGRIGKLLAQRLRGLGVRVTVTARDWTDLAWITAYGYEGILIDKLDANLSGYDILFNTIPHLILDADRLRRLDRKTLCIDLSSKPGGIDFEAAATRGQKTVWALGLPGEVAPETAGAIIRDTIYHILSEQGKNLC